MSWRPVGPSVHVGVRRSPLREPAEVVALAQRLGQHDADLRLPVGRKLIDHAIGGRFSSWVEPSRESVRAAAEDFALRMAVDRD